LGDRKKHVFAVIFYNIMHSGGKKVLNLKGLRIIPLFLVLALGIGFAAVKLASGNRQVNGDFGITAMQVPEGILLTFSNIPSDASHMWIGIITADDSEDPESSRGFISSNAAITNTSEMDWVGSSMVLERIRQTGTILFPFVQPNRKYYIHVMVDNLQTRELYIENYENINSHIASAELITEHGVYFNKDTVKLELVKSNSAITLFSEPVFSTEVNFADQKYRFAVIIEGVGSVGDHHIPDGLSSDGLTWTFEPRMSSYNLSGWIEEGYNYTAWAEAMAVLLYDDILWSVPIARTPVFNFSL
jgi:hypothetical protein